MNSPPEGNGTGENGTEGNGTEESNAAGNSAGGIGTEGNCAEGSGTEESHAAGNCAGEIGAEGNCTMENDAKESSAGESGTGESGAGKPGRGEQGRGEQGSEEQGNGEAGTWQAVRAELAARDYRPSRRLGQNMMVDANLARAIVRDGGVRAGDFVLEIGSGCASLTVPLVAAGARVSAVEIDGRLLEVARERLAAATGEAPPVKWIHCDVLDGKHHLAQEVREALPDEGSWRVVSNLPYSVGGPVTALLARLPNPPLTMTLLLQREMVDRLVAVPGTRDWGPLSVQVQALYGARMVRTVGPELFWPRPRVESAVLQLELLPQRPGAQEMTCLGDWTGILLGQRRKALLGLLGRQLGDRERAGEVLGSLGLDGSARPGELSVAELLALSRALGPPS
ncbi:MAG: 16S rRNA (adenine(1518)-N(6)/adenine(1519)-N(6))-dimethyltransferase RsmA [Planctomycetota bacterium]|nr:16S rRNA (adenine(1518)-N(6)/adenine(1519)-N(6))-dimethyltransferase RsmA [Planctomycetota bacterium]